MAEKKSRYFELLDHVGIAPSHIVTKKDELTGQVLEEAEHPNAGEPEPINHFTAHVAVPTMVDGEVVPSVQAIAVKPSDKLDELHASRVIPGSRVIETRSHLVAAAIEHRGDFREISAPRSEQPHRAKQQSTETAPASAEGKE